MAKILFYSPVKNSSLFDRVSFYTTDIHILRELGHEVVTSNSLRFVLNANYDVLFAYFYTWSSVAATIASLRGKLVLLTGGADEIDPCYNKLRKRLFLHRFFFRLGYFFSYRVLAVSTTDFKNFSELVGQKKLALVPHVVDTSSFMPGAQRIPQILLTIGWMGTEKNVRRKGMDTAIRILAELRQRKWNARLIIVGTSGPGTEVLQQLAADLNVSDYIEFKFSISEDEKIRLLQCSGYYLQLSEYEGFGLAALEALSCGSCVIHTGRGGLADFMSNYGLVQAWPLRIEDIADDIINHSTTTGAAGDEAYRRHSYVVQNFSLARRRAAFMASIQT